MRPALSRQRLGGQSGYLSILVASIVVIAEVASAQPMSWPPDRGGWSFNTTLQAASVYEDNVLFTEPSVAALFFRLTPGVETYYRNRLRTFRAGYTFDSEVYPQNLATLDDAFARQEAFAELRSRATARSRLSLTTAFLSTTRPEEVLQDTGLASLRRRTRSFAASAGIDRDLTRRLTWQAGYGFNFREFERPDPRIPQVGSVLHVLSTGVSYRHTHRTVSSLNYGARLLVQEDVAPGLLESNDFTSHVLAYLWTWEVSHKAELTLSVGPRFSESLAQEVDPQTGVSKARDVQPELRASFRHFDIRRDFVVRYTRSQFQPLGLGGFINTESVTFSGTFRPRTTLEIELTPAWYRNERGGLTTNAAQAYVAAHYHVSPWATLETSYLFHYQDGGTFFFDGPDEPPREPTSRNTILFGLRLSRIDWN